MRFPSTIGRYFLAIAVLLLPTTVFATDIYIDGTCVTGQGLGGNCPPPSGTSDAVGLAPAPSSTSGSGSSNITVGSDPFTVSWSYSASYGGGLTLVFNPSVTYTGGSPLASGDTVTVDLFQSYYDNSPGSWDGSYGETVNLSMSAGVAAASTASGQLCFTATTSQCLALETLNGPGPASVSDPNTGNLTLGGGNNLVAEYEFTYYFAPGTTNGATVSGVPEPAQALPLGLALLGLACYGVVVRRRSVHSR